MTTTVLLGALAAVAAGCVGCVATVICVRLVRTRRVTHRSRVVAEPRRLLLELAAAEPDEVDDARGALSRLTRREWDLLEPSLIDLLTKLRGELHSTLTSELADRGVIDDYVARTRARRSARRALAAELLGVSRTKSASGVLVAMLQDRNLQVRIVAARALGRIGDPTVAAQLLDTLDGAGSIPVGVVTEALLSIGSVPVPALTTALTSTSADARAAAANVAGRQLVLSERTRLAEVLGEDPNTEVRATAAQALGRLGVDDSTAPLVAATGTSQERRVRLAATTSLAEIETDEAVGRLTRLCSDPDPMVARAAGRSLLGAGAAGRAALDVQRRRTDAPRSVEAAWARLTLREGRRPGTMKETGT